MHIAPAGLNTFSSLALSKFVGIKLGLILSFAHNVNKVNNIDSLHVLIFILSQHLILNYH